MFVYRYLYKPLKCLHTSNPKLKHSSFFFLKIILLTIVKYCGF